jgi:hypothetical protein
MGRPRKIFKPYKDIKRKKWGIINFFVDGECVEVYRYCFPSKREIKINNFLRLAKRKTEIKHEYYYEIIPTIYEREKISPHHHNQERW